MITVNSGFFETVHGSSRIIKGVLTEKDIIDAPMANMAVRSQLQRAVGGFSFKGMLGNIMSKLPEAIGIAKQLAPVFKPMLPKGAQDAMSAVGFGGTGAGLSGASYAGAGKKSLSSRLM